MKYYIIIGAIVVFISISIKKVIEIVKELKSDND